MLSTLEQVRVDTHIKTAVGAGNAEAAHIVLLPVDLRETTTVHAYVMAARIEGFEIVALCGYAWVPHKDPKSLPVCQKCVEIYKADPNEFGDRNELPSP